MALIHFNTSNTGHIANYVLLPSVGGGQLFDGDLPADFHENYRFYRLEENGMVLDEALMQAVLGKEARDKAIADEMAALEAWLAEFDRKNAEYKRCVELGLPYAGGIEALKAEATAKYTRLLELRELIGKE